MTFQAKSECAERWSQNIQYMYDIPMKSWKLTLFTLSVIKYEYFMHTSACRHMQ